MITKIDIQNFGLFSDYNWDSEVGSDPVRDIFKKVNIIYGRNYSGKTTLSRIFRCVENGELHKDYNDAKFTILTDGTTKIDHSNLGYSKTIRVYNSDFVKDNLSWLHDNRGEILPFTLLGGDNTVIESKIKDIDIKLGLFDPVAQKYEDSGTYKEGSLYFEEHKKKQESTQINSKLRELTSSLDQKIINKAREIKGDSSLLSQAENAGYNKNSLQRDINNIIKESSNIALTNDEITKLQAIIKEEKKDPISQMPHVDFNIIDYISQVKKLVSKKITLSKVLKELVENDLLQAWVDEGRSIHKDKDTCGFCGSLITPERRKELDEHFSKESDELKKEIQKLSDKLKAEYLKIERYWESNNIKIEHFYSVYNVRFIDTNNKWKESLGFIREQLNILLEKLDERFINPFKPLLEIDFSEIENNSIDFKLIIDELNILIKDNEDKSVSIEQDRIKARKSLRYHTIHKFLNDIDYTSLVREITNKNTETETAKVNHDELIKKINELEREKEDLKKELRDEGRAAEKINKHLTDFFGVDGLKLEPSEQQIDNEVITHFVVKRGDQEAKNLSEGECSLVAFCYFMARIEDEIKAPDANDKLIIYIDDPISSLDSNHIFFVFGLINSIIVFADKIDNVRFNQLFISTHNLEFLKYLHRLAPFKGTYEKDSNTNMMHLLIEKRKKNTYEKSLIRLMPKHLRINTTEYIYLFKQIYDIAKPYSNIDDKIKDYEDNYTLLYNIGNNMRKFMESYLSFRYAGENDPLYLLNDFFSEIDGIQLNRASNEYSHLSWLEKGNSLLDIPEAERLAILILKGLRSNDETHYNALCKKIDVDPNIILS